MIGLQFHAPEGSPISRSQANLQKLAFAGRLLDSEENAAVVPVALGPRQDPFARRTKANPCGTGYGQVSSRGTRLVPSVAQATFVDRFGDVQRFARFRAGLCRRIRPPRR